jgi:CelD/BcsL family acetyltransferase involved in cellulose biosynthesis
LKVKEAQNFESVMEIWNPLLRKNMCGNSVFSTWEWLSTWWKHFGGKRELKLLTVEDENEVLAIAPLMLSKYKMPGFGSIKKIEFLGTRHSDYCNFIILKKKTECLKQIVDYLTSSISNWDWIELKEIPENPNCSEQLFSGLFQDLDVRERVVNLCPYISLPNSFNDLIDGLGKKLQKNLRRNARRIQKSHRIGLKRFDEAGFSVDEAMRVFIKLHQTKWEAEGFPGAFKESAFRDFHIDVAECLANEGWLGIYFLMADDEPISGQYNFIYEQKMYHYLAGWIPNYSSYSVGSLTIMLMLKRCIENGLTEYDMMRGDYTHKAMWTSKSRKNFEIRLVRKKMKSRFYNWVTWNPNLVNFGEKLHLSLKRDNAHREKVD